MAANEPERPARRLSFRRSLLETDLPSGYLDALELKRKQLDESIHKYIASKEREYKQFEKDIRGQAKRDDAGLNAAHQKHEQEIERVNTSQSKATHEASNTGATPVPDSAIELDEDADDNDALEQQKQDELDTNTHNNSTVGRDDFPGLFVPDYLAALDHVAPHHASAEPLSANAGGIPPPAATSKTDLASAARTQRPALLSLMHRTSSSGSSADNRLVSALRSPTDHAPRTSRKRVSLAVGDSIVAPSDSVPLSMTTNSTSSHSKTRASTLLTSSSRNTHSSNALSEASDAMSASDAQSTAIQALQEEGSASAASAKDSRRSTSGVASRGKTVDDDIGDMFDLDEDELDASYENASFSISPEDNLDNEIVGRVSKHLPHDGNVDDDMSAGSQSIELGEPPPDSEDITESAALTFAESSSSAQQPVSPGFRRPSAALDPMYAGSSYREVEKMVEDSSFYGSSFSRSNKGSFTSSSLGESYMARNAEKMMGLRAKQQSQERQQQSRQPTHVVPVR